MVAVRLNDDKIGTGLIISHTHILTVAQLLYPMKGKLNSPRLKYDVWVRPIPGQLYDKAFPIIDFYIHRNFDPKSLIYDIGVILVSHYIKNFIEFKSLSNCTERNN